MKILFVYPDISMTPNYAGYVYLGIGYLSSILKKQGHSTELLHITRPISAGEFIDRLKEKTPDLLAFTSTTNTARFIKQWAGAIKQSRGITTIFGGVHPSLQPEDCIKFDGIDMVCIGEGEEALLDVCNRLSRKDYNLSDIPNIWFKKDNKIYKNEPRPLLQDLDLLPFPDRGIYNYEDSEEAKEGVYRILAVRGCPYTCSYCFNHAYRGIYKNSASYVRFRSPENIIEEMGFALKRYKTIRYFHFVNDILTLKKDWFSNLVKLYKKYIGLPYIAQARPNLIDEENIRLLKESGCFQLQMGIESGSDYVRNSILKRNITKEQIEDAFKLADKYGLRTYAYNMVGIPFEDKNGIMETVRLNAIAGVNITHTSFFYPYPCTELESLCRQNGLIEKDWNLDYFSDTVLRFEKTTKEFMIFIRRFFLYLVRIYSKIYKFPPVFKKLALRLMDSVVMNYFFYTNINRICSIIIKIKNIKSETRKQDIY